MKKVKRQPIEQNTFRNNVSDKSIYKKKYKNSYSYKFKRQIINK